MAERNDTGRVDAAQRWLEPDHAAQRCRHADRAARVAADRPIAHSHRHRHRRAARRAARHAAPVMRVAHRTVVRVDARHSVGKLVQVGLAHDHAAVGADALDDGGVLRGGRGGKDDAARRCHHAGDVDEVLHRHHRPAAALG